MMEQEKQVSSPTLSLVRQSLTTACRTPCSGSTFLSSKAATRPRLLLLALMHLAGVARPWTM